MEKQTHKPNLITLSMLISIGLVSGIIFTPAIPDIAHFFGVSFTKVQLSVSIFFIAYALGQLYTGPFCIRFGKKKTIYIALSVAFIGSLFSGLSSFLDFRFLVISRFILALGSAIGYALTFLIINEYYSHEQSRKMLPKAALGQAIYPFGSTVIGGFISEYLSWPYIFYFLCLYIILLIFLCNRLIETIEQIKPIKKIHHYNLSDYFKVLKFPHLPLFAFLTGCGIAMVLIFATGAPFLAIHVMHLRNSHYGLMNLFIVGGNVFGFLLASKISKYFSAITVIIFGISIIILSSFTMLFLFLIKIINPWSLFIPELFIFIGISLSWANAIPLAVKNIAQKSHASSMLAFIINACGVIGIFSLSAFNVTKPLLMPTMFLTLSLLQWIIFIFARNALKKID